MKIKHNGLAKLAGLILLILTSIQAASAYNTVFINFNNTAWTIGSQVNLTGHYYNITNFTLLPNGSITITRWTNYTNGEGLTINATNINISGNITGDGTGFPGSAGGGGGNGGCGAGSSCNNGGRSGGTNWDSTTATNGNTPSFLTGGSGGAASSSYYGLDSSQNPVTTSGASGHSGSSGGGTCVGTVGTASSGSNAPVHTENSTAANATMGGGGSAGGGSGGGGASSTYNDGGGGGAGGGAGGDGGSFIILVASNRISLSPLVSISMRPGQTSCSARTGTNGGAASGSNPNGGSGGSGGSTNNAQNCVAGSGGSGGAGTTKSCTGGSGGSGGSGAAGEIVLIAPTIDEGNNSLLNVTDTLGGGSIKILYRVGILNPTLIAGYSVLSATSYDNPPNISNVVITPSPATASQNLSCNWTITDIDGDLYNVSINWTVNGTLKTSHNQSLTVGNYSNNDNVTCMISASDGMLTTAWTNSPTILLNDNRSPTIWNLYTDQVNVTTADTVTFTANTTDNESNMLSTACKFTFVKSDYNGGNGVGNPYNITTNTINGSLISYSQSMTSLGTGTLQWTKTFCADQSNNLATNNSVNINIVITQYIPPPPSSGGGSGGGGGGSTGTSTSDFAIIRPANGFIFPLCPSGQAGASQEYELYNQGTTTLYFTTGFKGINCITSNQTFSVAAKDHFTGTVSQCPCPTSTDKSSGEFDITSNANTQTISISLYNNFLTRILNDPTYLAKAAILTFIIILLGITTVIVGLSIKKNR